MPDSVSVRIEGLDRLAERLSPAQFRRAVLSLVNKAGKQLDTEASRTLRSVYAIKASSYTKARKITRAGGSNLTYRITIKNQAFPLSAFNAKEKKPKGVTFRVRKDKGRQLLRSGFMHNGQVWRRASSGAGLVPRLPIEFQYGPSFAKMAEVTSLEQALVNKGNSIIPKIWEQELRFRTG